MGGTQPRASPRSLVWPVLALLVLLFASLSTGLVSSNDGSHVALGRALVLRQTTVITPEVGLTLWVDRSRRDGADYSDRPPGTAFAALGALWLGDKWDAGWGAETVARLKAGAEADDLDALVVVRPGTDRYIQTYGARRVQQRSASPNLIDLQGTALLVGFHCAVIGGLGLVALVLLLRRREVDAQGQVIVVLAIGGATLWGPYSTMLFSHVTAATALAWCVVGVESLREASSRRAIAGFAALAGGAGAWAVSADYALVVAIVPWVLLGVPWRRALLVAGAAVPLALATAAYHDAAFGSPFSIGYDHHATFAFTRSRVSTFSGNPFVGLWTLWGAGQGAGILVLSPVLLLGAYGWRWEWKLALSVAPWALLLCFHQTPGGGAGEDYRYLIPALVPLGVGLGRVWQRFSAFEGGLRTKALGGFIALAALSALSVWSHFFAWRG